MAVQTVAKARFWKHWERFHDFTSRAAVYAIRTYGGKGGAPRKRRPYPTRFSLVFRFVSRGRVPVNLFALAGFSNLPRD